MKKIITGFIAALVLLIVLSSCAAAKRDCHGVKHHKHKNGFYI
jgi:hypothetical protein